MLTGDENIVDINFTVFWLVKDAKDYLFNIRNPELTVKAAAESAMREVIGHTEIASALAEGRGKIETDTQALAARASSTSYSAGIEITQVQLQKVDPPGPVIDAFRDVQSAKIDQQRLINEAEAYRNDVVPRGAWRCRRASCRRRRPIRRRSCCRRRATRRGSYRSIKPTRPVAGRDRAPALHRDDGEHPQEHQQGRDRQAAPRRRACCPICRCRRYRRARGRGAGIGARPIPSAPPRNASNRNARRPRDEPHLARLGGVAVVVADPHLQHALHRRADRDRRWCCNSASRCASSTSPGCTSSCPIKTSSIYDQPHPRFRAAGRRGDRRRPEAAGRRYLCAVQASSIRCSSIRASARRTSADQRLSSIISASLRRIIGNVELQAVISSQRANIMQADPRRGESARRRASASMSSTSGSAAPICREENEQAIYARMKAERQREAAQYRAARRAAGAADPRRCRPAAHRDHRRRAEAGPDPARRRRRAEHQDLRRRLRQGPQLLRLLPLVAGLSRQLDRPGDDLGAVAGQRLLQVFRERAGRHGAARRAGGRGGRSEAVKDFMTALALAAAIEGDALFGDAGMMQRMNAQVALLPVPALRWPVSRRRPRRRRGVGDPQTDRASARPRGLNSAILIRFQ